MAYNREKLKECFGEEKSIAAITVAINASNLSTLEECKLLLSEEFGEIREIGQYRKEKNSLYRTILHVKFDELDHFYEYGDMDIFFDCYLNERNISDIFTIDSIFSKNFDRERFMALNVIKIVEVSVYYSIYFRNLKFDQQFMDDLLKYGFCFEISGEIPLGSDE